MAPERERYTGMDGNKSRRGTETEMERGVGREEERQGEILGLVELHSDKGKEVEFLSVDRKLRHMSLKKHST